MNPPQAPGAPRESFGSRLGLLATMVGVAVGLGNVWRFPYMVGKFGGAAFVLVYLVAVLLLGVPALAAEWALGRHTRRGPVGAFARAGLPGGRAAGWFFFAVMLVATGYYTNALGWVLSHALGEAARLVGVEWNAGAILPPASGFAPRSFLLQAAATALLLGAIALVLLKGLRAGIERASRVLVPLLFAVLLVLIARALTLPGAGAGVAWYLGKFDLAALEPRVVAAAFGQVFFSLSLGGTMMVVYGSYLGADDDIPRNAAATALGDTAAGLLAGLGILPAVVALGLEPTSGPDLLFVTLPRVFARLPAGGLFGLLFYLGLLGAAFLSAVAAYEVQVAALTDTTRLDRRRAVWLLAGAIAVGALPPMVNLRIFVAWDLTFGSGMQALGALCAVLAAGWWLDRAALLRELGGAAPGLAIRLLCIWIRYVVPLLVVGVGLWWLLSEALAG